MNELMFFTRITWVFRGFSLLFFLLNPLDCPYILPHFSQELIKWIFLDLSVVKIVRPELVGSEIVDHRIKIVFWFRTMMMAPIKLFKIFHLPEEEFTLKNKKQNQNLL